MSSTTPIVNHYRKLLQEHGDTAESAQWSSRQSQEQRFKYLTQIGSLEGMRVLDFGCGTGHLATYLKSQEINVTYTGIDIVDEFFPVCRAKHPGHRFSRIEDIKGERFDYVFVSGVFNNKQKNNRKFYQDSVCMLFGLCDIGLAFNMMSTYVDYQDKNLFYEDPGRAFKFVKQEITPFVVLRHDYEVKEGVIPFEFIIYAYRGATS
ncbi:MAG: methyltransferase [Candidatus Electrothrix sp. Rat3]|nr:methyltransferase [Candidatus Electrothrix rattekaaiensis]